MIRLAKNDDVPKLESIFAFAREQMRRNGNPTQWGENRPAVALLYKDIENDNLYVLEEAGEIQGVFAFILGVDATYLHIENGSWLNEEPYGTIHRIAAGPGCRGLMAQVLAFCEERTDNIRIDTHEDNAIMRHLLTKNGFRECGIIYVDNGTSRVAYQKVVR